MGCFAVSIGCAWLLGFLGIVSYHERGMLLEMEHRAVVAAEGAMMHHFASHHKHRHEPPAPPRRTKLLRPAAPDPNATARAAAAWAAAAYGAAGVVAAQQAAHAAHCTPATSGRRLELVGPPRNARCGLSVATKCQPAIAVAPAQGSACADCEVAVVLRDPHDRLASALSWTFKGVDGRSDDMLMDDTEGVENPRCFSYVGSAQLASDALDDREGFYENCRAFDSDIQPFRVGEPPSDPLFSRQIDYVGTATKFLCFENLDADFETVVRPYCATDAARERRCQLDSSLAKRIDGFAEAFAHGEKLKYGKPQVGRVWCRRARRHTQQFTNESRVAIENYVRDVYAEDLKLYEKHCGGVARHPFWAPDPPHPQMPPMPEPPHIETAYERKQRKLSGHHWWNVALSLKKMFF
ncbi:hypothetical protein JL720_9102 [Aureococcus anophagefferens]|nr:hypothetical protein JL720_9102 [Aureococcus anophagefferens]